MTVDHKALFDIQRRGMTEAIRKAMTNEPSIDWLLENQDRIIHKYYQMGSTGRFEPAEGVGAPSPPRRFTVASGPCQRAGTPPALTPDAAMNEPAPPGPVIILVQPQLAENIGMTARAMANFGLSELRLVAPKNGWPKKGVREAASGATHVLDGAAVYDTLAEAIADLHFVLATTARERGQMKRVLAPDEAMRDVAARAGSAPASSSVASARASTTTRFRSPTPS